MRNTRKNKDKLSRLNVDRAKVARAKAAVKAAKSNSPKRKAIVIAMDIDTPKSLLVKTRLKDLINMNTYKLLSEDQRQVVNLLLPSCDQKTDLSMLNAEALNNEFFAKACVEWQERLTAGDFRKDRQNLSSSWKKMKHVNSYNGYRKSQQLSHFNTTMNLCSRNDHLMTSRLNSHLNSSSTSIRNARKRGKRSYDATFNPKKISYEYTCSPLFESLSHVRSCDNPSSQIVDESLKNGAIYSSNLNVDGWPRRCQRRALNEEKCKFLSQKSRHQTIDSENDGRCISLRDHNYCQNHVYFTESSSDETNFCIQMKSSSPATTTLQDFINDSSTNQNNEENIERKTGMLNKNGSSFVVALEKSLNKNKRKTRRSFSRVNVKKSSTTRDMTNVLVNNRNILTNLSPRCKSVSVRSNGTFCSNIKDDSVSSTISSLTSISKSITNLRPIVVLTHCILPTSAKVSTTQSVICTSKDSQRVVDGSNVHVFHDAVRIKKTTSTLGKDLSSLDCKSCQRQTLISASSSDVSISRHRSSEPEVTLVIHSSSSINASSSVADEREMTTSLFDCFSPTLVSSSSSVTCEPRDSYLLSTSTSEHSLQKERRRSFFRIVCVQKHVGSFRDSVAASCHDATTSSLSSIAASCHDATTSSLSSIDQNCFKNQRNGFCSSTKVVKLAEKYFESRLYNSSLRGAGTRNDADPFGNAFINAETTRTSEEAAKYSNVLSQEPVANDSRRNDAKCRLNIICSRTSSESSSATVDRLDSAASSEAEESINCIWEAVSPSFNRQLHL